MPKGSEQLTNARKEEIINACAKLYTTMNFKGFPFSPNMLIIGFQEPGV